MFHVHCGNLDVLRQVSEGAVHFSCYLQVELIVAPDHLARISLSIQGNTSRLSASSQESNGKGTKIPAHCFSKRRKIRIIHREISS
jgi:hypothetical protein